MLFLPLENKAHIFVQSIQLLHIWEAGQERRLADQKKKLTGGMMLISYCLYY